ncbi:unnamed protein product [Symbiodinium natans]|uniref:Uncharacterized protein n=1 Tax=Symbiodinium natans TaxID=878477 RepID=A0A812V1G1_9DINO|nr:unnamed protein product [Symbiodinium natans]
MRGLALSQWRSRRTQAPKRSSSSWQTESFNLRAHGTWPSSRLARAWTSLRPVYWSSPMEGPDPLLQIGFKHNSPAGLCGRGISAFVWANPSGRWGPRVRSPLRSSSSVVRVCLD